MDERTNGSLVIDAEMIESWQEIVDLMAEILDVPAGLIMRVTGEDIEVFVSSHTEGNPYHVADREHLLGSGLYCEHVTRTRAPLHVPNALADRQWDHNPDIKLGMISYHGHPIVSPDGDMFGTICVLDSQPHELNAQYDRLIQRFKTHIEQNLELLWRSQELGRRNRELSEALDRVHALEGVLPTCQYCKKIRLQDSNEDDPKSWVPIETYIRERSNARFSHGICPDCLRKLREDA